MSVHVKANGTWFVQYRVAGEKNPQREYIGSDPGAKLRAYERDSEIKRLKALNQRIHSTDIYLDSLAQQYLADRKMHGASPAWLKEMVRLLNIKILPHLCHKPVDFIKYSDIITLCSKLWPRVKLATRQRYLSYLKAIFSFGVEHELCQKNPLAKWKREKEPRLDMRLTLEDLEKLIKHASPHLAWALIIQWELGTRPGASELFSLRYEDIDYKNGTIHIKGTKTATSDRYVPILPHFIEMLQKMEKQSVSGFLIEYKGKPVKSLKKSLKTAQERAGIKYHIRLYDIRHLFVSSCLSNTADLGAISKYIGHASSVTTLSWYHHVLPNGMREAVEKKPRLSSQV